MKDTCIYIISEPKNPSGEAYFKLGKTNNIKKRLTHIQLGNPRMLSLSFTYRTQDDNMVLEKFLQKEIKSASRQYGEWFFGKLEKVIKEIEAKIKLFELNPKKYENLCQKEKWGTNSRVSIENTEIGQRLINSILHFRFPKGKRKRSWDKVADLIYKEGFRNTKGKRIGRSYIIQVLSRIKTGRLDVKKNYKLPNETLNRRSEYFNKYDKENIK